MLTSMSKDGYDEHFPPLNKVRHTYIHTYIHNMIILRSFISTLGIFPFFKIEKLALPKAPEGIVPLPSLLLHVCLSLNGRL